MQPLFSAESAAAWIFAGAYAVWILPELAGGAVDALRRRRRQAERVFDRSSGSLILAGILLLPVAAVEIALHLTVFAIASAPSILFAAGIAAMLLGVLLRWQAVHSLGRHFSRSVAIQREHEVVTVGPYRWVRHPSYSGTLLTLLGIGVASGNWLSILVLVGGGLAVYAYRVSVEERVLCRELGEPYRNYMRSTSRFIPWLL